MTPQEAVIAMEEFGLTYLDGFQPGTYSQFFSLPQPEEGVTVAVPNSPSRAELAEKFATFKPSELIASDPDQVFEVPMPASKQPVQGPPRAV